VTGTRQDPCPHVPVLYSSSDGFSWSGSRTCSGNTWGTRHVPCSLFPVPCSLKDFPPPKKFSLRRPCGAPRFSRLTCSLFPVPCSHKTPVREHVFRVPCSLSPYGKTHRCILRVLGSDRLHHSPGRPSAKGIFFQFKSLPPTTTPATLDGTICPR